MEIRLYKTVSENNRVEKILTDEKILNGSCRGEVDVVTPSVTVKGDISKYNFCFIPSFNRYYYIENVTLVNNMSTIILKTDVLMSYASSIKLLQAILEESDTANNPYYNKGYEVEQRISMDKIEFTNNFSNGEYILICLKGSETNG